MDSELPVQSGSHQLPTDWVNEHFQTLFCHVNDSVVVTDAERRVLLANPAAERLFGWSADELAGQDSRAILKIETGSYGDAARRALVERGTWRGVIEAQRRDGVRMVLDIDSTALPGPGGELAGILSVQRQIAGSPPLHTGAADVAASLYAARGSAVVEAGRDGTIRLFAGDAQRMLGRFPSEVVGRQSVVSLLDRGELARRAGEAGLEPGFDALLALVGQDAHPDWTFARPDGEQVFVELSTVPITGGDADAGCVLVLRDVSERHRAVEALDGAARRFLGVFEASPVPSAITTLAEGRMLAVNHSCARMLGREQDELVGLTVSQIGMWARPERRTAVIERLRREGRVQQSQEAMRACSGEVLDVLTSLELIEFDRQQCVMETFRDVSERVRVQAALQASEARLRTFIEHAPGAVFLKDRAGRFLIVNRTLAAELGRPADEIVGRIASDFMVPEDARSHEATDRAQLDAGGFLEGDAIVPAGGDEPERILTYVRFPVIGEDGEITGLGGISWDVTAQRRLELAALVSAERVRLLLESTAEGILGVDPEGICTFINTAAASALGYELAELIGRRVHDVIHHSHEDGSSYPWQACPTRRTLREATPVRTDSEVFWRKDGTAFPVDFSARAIRVDGEIVGAVEVFTDITERRQLLEALAVARDDALEGSRLKSEFLARMSHEIRTPMNGVIGMASLLLETDLDDEQREFARTARSSAEALRAVIDDILDFSKIEAGRLDLEEADFDLGELVEDVCAMLAGSARAKGTELVAAIPPELPSALRGDALRIRQVLTNLIGNAVKFTDGGQVVAGVNVVDESEGAITVRVEVSDTGIGIPDEARAGVFESFFQADASTTRRYGGSGLGLTISQRLVTMMGGEIGFESEPGQGSTFWFALTLAPGHGVPAAPHGSLEGRSVLVVDDLATNRAILTAWLDHWGMRPVSAAGGNEALKLALSAAEAGEPFDVVVTDLRMPGMDGIELASAMADLGLPTRVVILSSDGGREPLENRPANVFAVVMKPPRHSQLRDTLASALGDPSSVDRREPPIVQPTPMIGCALIVDDVAVNRQVTHAMLTRAGFAVREASDGREALAALAREDFDVILMDCQMPVMDGYAAATEIRRLEGDGRRTPIIALTASAMKGDSERALAAGMDLHVTKPIAIERLQAALVAALGATPVPEAPPAEDEVAGPLDVERLRKLGRLYPDAGARREFFELFLDDSPQRIGELVTVARAGDADAVWQGAHALHGACGLIGAHRMVALLTDMQDRARGGRVPNASELAALQRAYADAAAALAREP